MPGAAINENVEFKLDHFNNFMCTCVCKPHFLMSCLECNNFIMHWMKQFQQIMTKERWKVVTWPFVSGWFVFDCSLLFSVETAQRPIRADCNTTKHDFTRPPNTIKQLWDLIFENLETDLKFTSKKFPEQHQIQNHTQNTSRCRGSIGLEWNGRWEYPKKLLRNWVQIDELAWLKKTKLFPELLSEKEIGWARG